MMKVFTRPTSASDFLSFICQLAGSRVSKRIYGFCPAIPGLEQNGIQLCFKMALTLKMAPKTDVLAITHLKPNILFGIWLAKMADPSQNGRQISMRHNFCSCEYFLLRFLHLVSVDLWNDIFTFQQKRALVGFSAI
jgi:hypothetical protein